jgi:tetratricopeptide (TPR) repeat protein
MYCEAAAEFFLLAQNADSGQRPRYLLDAARNAVAGNQVFSAIDFLNQVIAADSKNEIAHRELAGLLCAVGRNQHAIASLEHLMFTSRAGFPELMVLANPIRPTVDAQWIFESLRSVPEDLRPEVGLVSLDLNESRFAAAHGRASKVLSQLPVDPLSWLVCGQAVLEFAPVEDSLSTWASVRPSGTEEFAEYWILIGRLALLADNGEVATRAFGEAAFRNPYHPQALQLFAQSLTRLERLDLATEVGRYAEAMQEMLASVNASVEADHQSQARAIEVAERMLELGRVWEAESWARLANGLSNDLVTSAREFHRKCARRLRSTSPRLSDEFHPRRWRDQIMDLPLSELEPLLTAIGSKASDPPTTDGIRFEEEGASRGLVFHYDNGAEDADLGEWIYQANGPGVAAIDYDLDGWLDLCFPQGGSGPRKFTREPHSLFRNISGRYFRLSCAMVLPESGYGQGAQAGDLNEDGFPDLVISEVGAIRILMNAGDGTFVESKDCGVVSTEWNTTSVIADLTEDGIVDIYQVCYCNLEQVLSTPCFSKSGKHAVCAPTAFRAEPDRLFRGVGDGTFEDVSLMVETDRPGRGLGAVATNFDSRPGLELFVANDMSENHFFVRGMGEGPRKFVDQGLLRGVSLDARGRAQASMGIAVGDPDRDGDLDFAVTAFSNEPDAYYMQVRSGIFEDRAQLSGLFQPSFLPLAFGCQFADFDGNGALDYLVTNGHVDPLVGESGQAGVEYQQAPQCYSYQHRWVEIPGESIGDYFRHKHVGRGLQLLDVDNNGWPDVVVAALHENAGLLVNRSKVNTVPLVVELVGKTGTRDPIGARVVLIGNGKPDVRWITSGDGFQGSNAKRSWFAINPGSRVLLRVVWPSGKIQDFPNIAAGHYLIIEDIPDPVERSYL